MENRKILVVDVGFIYAFTGYRDLFGLLESRKAGFDNFFSKPASLKELLDAAGYAFDQLERWGVEELGLL